MKGILSFKEIFRFISRKISLLTFGFVSKWYNAIFALSLVLVMASGVPVRAESVVYSLDQTGVYAGVFAGFGRLNNRIVDVEGFANWGNPGSVVDYEENEYTGGVLVGRKVNIGGALLRIEVDGIFGVRHAKSNMLDPVGLDETVETKIPWIATSRIGGEYAIGRAKLFATGGLAVAQITNSVTDIDFGRNMPRRLDPDDSFRESSTKIGWVIGIGIETLFDDAWTLRFGGSYLDFGRSVHQVNRSGNNSCGPGGPRTSCPYKIENKYGIIRLAIIRHFGT